MSSLPVNSVTFNIQPDGQWAGVPALMIRLMQNPEIDVPTGKDGPLQPIADWEYDPSNEISLNKMLGKKFHGPEFSYVGPSTLAKLALTHHRYHIVIHGPEPASHDLTMLVRDLITGGCRVQIDTTGHVRTDVEGSWTTLRANTMSDWAGIHPDTIKRADEILVSIRDSADIRRAKAMFGGLNKPVWLRPAPTAESTIFRQCVEAAAEYRQWRAVK
jgi:hypothetical protein